MDVCDVLFDQLLDLVLYVPVDLKLADNGLLVQAFNVLSRISTSRSFLLITTKPARTTFVRLVTDFFLMVWVPRRTVQVSGTQGGQVVGKI